MNTLLLLLALILPPQQQDVPVMPGTAYARPATGVVLRSAPGRDFPSVLTLDGTTVVRIGALVGDYREVFVPQGFPVYMHAEFLEYSAADSTARVTGNRVNMRLLPSLEGLLPIGTLSAGSGPLVVLEKGTEWMRVLAPVVVPLYALDSEVPAVADGEAAGAWKLAYATRVERISRAAEAHRARDPQAQHQDALLARTEALADVDVAALDEAGQQRRRAELEHIRGQSTVPGTTGLVDQMLGELDELARLRRAAETSAEQVTLKSNVSVVDDLTVRRESRMLAMGLAFKGKGDALTREGSVHKGGLPDAPIYALHTTDGEVLKLMAPPHVATFEALVGKRIKVDGRKLLLMVVDGPVLVVDKLVSYTPR